MYTLVKKEDIYALQSKTDVERIRIIAKGFKNNGTLLPALKYSLWALKQGGILEVFDSGPNSDHISPYNLPFSLIQMQVISALKENVEILKIDSEKYKIFLKKITANPEKKWQCGIIFSGQENEKSSLLRCIQSIRNENELASENSIIVCGPKINIDFLNRYKNVSYLVYHNPKSNNLFPISSKKNFLIESMTAPFIVIMHTRISLPNGFLTSVPNNFDFATCKVVINVKDKVVPYISFSMMNLNLPFQAANEYAYSSRLFNDPRKYSRGKFPVIDGALFFANRNTYLKCKQNELLNWGQAEDVEWAFRAYSNCILMDYWPSIIAISHTNKLTIKANIPMFIFRLGQVCQRRLRTLYYAFLFYFLK